ncbi:O-antigen ligase domain-containing protein [Dyella solisilvae]|uniref:O-antigen ligase domain-containing protein n=1 Tax=Dyella solisilvae TaxID=1920168 RepID=A0A370K330_9GAMM|nr:O-antigen ligase family protein [Dyella solisilvae]RDI97052.1 O-antigen ligase domain-containing protein [Dyella solisilvae]
MFPLILLYLVLTIVRPQDYIPALVGVPVLPVVLVLAFLSWLGSRARTFDAPQFAILPAFLLVLMISQATNGWTGGMLDQLAKFGPTVISFFILSAACTTRRHVVITMAVIALCSFVLALHGVQQASNGVGWTGIPVGEDGRIQYVGIFNDPNDLGLLFVAAVPMAVYLGKHSGMLGKLLWYSGTLLLLYGIRLTNSRGALLAVLMMAGIYVWYRRGALMAGALGVVGLACLKLLSSRMQELDAGEESANGRVDAWYSGLHMFMSHPLFGVGAGNFTEYNELTAHNSFVLVLAEAGFVGYVLWLAFVCYSFWMLWLVLRYRADAAEAPEAAAQWQIERPLALALFIVLCGMFTTAFFLSRSYMIVLYLILAMVVGYFVGARQRLPGLETIRMTRGWWRWVPAAMGSIVGLYVLVAILLRTA